MTGPAPQAGVGGHAGDPRSVAGRGSPELDWLAEVLWGPTPGVEVVVGRVPAGAAASQRWGALPSLSRPRVLVPLASRRAAAQAVRQYATA